MTAIASFFGQTRQRTMPTDSQTPKTFISFYNNNNIFIDVLKVQKALHKYRKNISQIQFANDSEIRLYGINSALMATQKF